MRLIQILKILEPYMDEFQKEYPLWAEHDIVGFKVDPESIQKCHLEELENLGVHFDSEYDSLVMYV